MHRYRAWGLSAALAFGSSVTTTVAAEPVPTSTAPTESKPWYGRIFGSDEPEPPTPTRPPIPTRPTIATAPLPPEAVASALRAEQEAYLRRLEVCTKLRHLAVNAGDDSLLQQADTLEQQATALYHGRVARLGVKSVRPAIASRPLPGPSPVTVLDRELGSGVAITPLESPTPADESGRPATASTQTFRRAPRQ